MIFIIPVMIQKCPVLKKMSVCVWIQTGFPLCILELVFPFPSFLTYVSLLKDSGLILLLDFGYLKFYKLLEGWRFFGNEINYVNVYLLITLGDHLLTSEWIFMEFIVKGFSFQTLVSLLVNCISPLDRRVLEPPPLFP